MGYDRLRLTADLRQLFAILSAYVSSGVVKLRPQSTYLLSLLSTIWVSVITSVYDPSTALVYETSDSGGVTGLTFPFLTTPRDVSEHLLGRHDYRSRIPALTIRR